MQKTKILSVVTSLALAITLSTSVFAEDQFIPDVENLVAEVVESGIKLMWDPVDGADSYTVYYGTQSISEDGASYENDVLLGNVTEYTVEDLIAGVTYYFSAAADDSTGTYLGSYNYSEEVSATTSEIVVPVDDPVEPIEPAEPTMPVEIVVPEVDPIVEELIENIYPSASEPTPTTTLESLPQSGPATAMLVLISGTGAYFYRKFRK